MSDNSLAIVPDSATFDLGRSDPKAALERAEIIVKHMAARCTGPRFISRISGREYPKVEWWTTVGSSMGLFPCEVSSVKVKDDPLTYEAIVEVRHSGQTISRASAICSREERTWAKRDEYAIKSMATTRATGKAYRLPFSFLAVMAGLEPTPAEEMPPDEERPKDAPARDVTPKPAAAKPEPKTPEQREYLDILAIIEEAVKQKGMSKDAGKAYQNEMNVSLKEGGDKALGELQGIRKRVVEYLAAKVNGAVAGNGDSSELDAAAEAGWENAE